MQIEKIERSAHNDKRFHFKSRFFFAGFDKVFFRRELPELALNSLRLSRSFLTEKIMK